MGARFVRSQETDEGRAWDEVLIKTLTGGDRLTARFMRQDFFEFEPRFTLVIAGNHKPRLRNVDEAAKRRIHMVPFSVTVPEARRDPGLRDKLMAEAPGILRWAIHGCLEYQQRKSLAAPAAVIECTREYFGEQDPLQGWLDECVAPDPQAFVNRTELAASYRAYVKAKNDAPMTCMNDAQFYVRLEGHGYPQKKRDVRGFVGLRLLQRAEIMRTLG